jgi:hypothetical protein
MIKFATASVTCGVSREEKHGQGRSHSLVDDLRSSGRVLRDGLPPRCSVGRDGEEDLKRSLVCGECGRVGWREHERPGVAPCCDAGRGQPERIRCACIRRFVYRLIPSSLFGTMLNPLDVKTLGARMVPSGSGLLAWVLGMSGRRMASK